MVDDEMGQQRWQDVTGSTRDQRKRRGRRRSVRSRESAHPGQGHREKVAKKVKEEVVENVSAYREKVR